MIRMNSAGEGIQFLAFVVTPDRLRLNQTAICCQGRRIRTLRAAYAASDVGWQDVRASRQAWSACAAHGTTSRPRSDVFAKARVGYHPALQQPAEQRPRNGNTGSGARGSGGGSAHPLGGSVAGCLESRQPRWVTSGCRFGLPGVHDLVGVVLTSGSGRRSSGIRFSKYLVGNKVELTSKGIAEVELP